MLEIDFMERQSVALADTVFSPSQACTCISWGMPFTSHAQYMVNWLRSQSWELPACLHVLPNPALPHQCTQSKATLHVASVHTRRDLV